MDEVSNSWVDDPLGTDNPTVVCHGKDGASGANGQKGDKGDKGDHGDHGDHGDKGDKGDHGDKGDKGDHGQHGKGFRKVVVQSGDPAYPSGCQQKPAFVVYTQHVDEVLNSWVDDPLGTNNPTVICQGKDGKDGNPGKAYGWHKKFGSASISSTSTAVLSQAV